MNINKLLRCDIVQKLIDLSRSIYIYIYIQMVCENVVDYLQALVANRQPADHRNAM